MPMRDVVIGLKDALHESDAEILAFRRKLEERKDLRVFHYANAKNCEFDSSRSERRGRGA